MKLLLLALLGLTLLASCGSDPITGGDGGTTTKVDTVYIYDTVIVRRLIPTITIPRIDTVRVDTCL